MLILHSFNNNLQYNNPNCRIILLLNHQYLKAKQYRALCKILKLATVCCVTSQVATLNFDNRYDAELTSNPCFKYIKIPHQVLLSTLSAYKLGVSN